MSTKIKRRKFIKNSIQTAVLLGLGGSQIFFQKSSRSKEIDILILKGLVFDGQGTPPQEADIAIKGNKIYRVTTNINPDKAKRIINARGLAIAPGFIDAHSHTDVGLLVNPRAESQVRQGVTTEISGNCGFSPFPISDAVFSEYHKYYKEEYDIKLDWRDINGFFKRLGEKGIALNYATLLGHGNLRGEVVGYYDRPPTEKEIRRMRKKIRENLNSGALGMSSGLEYAPGSYADTRELIELCHEVARFRGIYATHMRDEGDKLLESMEEAIQISKKTGVSLQISHLKVAYQRNWPKIDDAITKIESAAKEGINILADRYPYVAGSTGLSYFFPLWSKQGITKEFIARLKDPNLDSKIRNHLKEQEKKLGSWDKVLISSVFTEKNKTFEGKNILEAAGEIRKEPYEFIRDLLIEEENRVAMILFFASEENLKRILAHPLVVIGADGEAVAPYGLLGKGKPHPRYYGTFTRILGRYARNEKIFSLGQAIKKMTSLTAQKFGLKHRGQIKENYFADVVIFNPDKVSDQATWEKPKQYPLGIEWVVVNGKIIIQNGEHTGSLPGRILKKSTV
ncbi:MAG: D-aminoacylase [Candidatus Aminicenantes bacterium]|nr:D-aminoacylase [Candidatus Aminicenantes bacterium]